MSSRRRRYKVRYDRIIEVSIVFLVLIVILVSCISKCGKDDEPKNFSSSGVIDNTVSGTNPPATDNQGSKVDNVPDVTAPVSNSVIYTTESVAYDRMNMGDLVVVNATYDYKFTETVNVVDVYSNRNDYYGVADQTVLLDSSVIYQLNILMEAFSINNNNNTDLSVIGGYRSKEDQEERYTSGSSSIQPGYSDYHAARSFNVGYFPKDSGSNYLENIEPYSWFYQNCANYGFIVRHPEGKEALTGDTSRQYTFRYVGIPHAIYITQNNICLEEYIDAIKAYTKDAPLKITDGSKNYEVYYVLANANNVTEVPVPSNQTYTISGNNIDGFIVTVTLG